MNEKRLMEIAATISKLDGPLVVLGYLTSLKESDVYLFLLNVKGSKYGKLDWYVATKKFSEECLMGKELDMVNVDLENFGYNSGNYDEYFKNYNFNNGVIEQFNSEINQVDTIDFGKKR